MAADETIDLQAVTIGVGTLLAIGFLVYGTIASPSVFGVATTTAAAWAFAATFAVLAVLHAMTGRTDLGLAHGGAAVGWGLVLVGSSGAHVLAGLLLLGLGGGYIARTTIRARTEQRAQDDGESENRDENEDVDGDGDKKGEHPEKTTSSE
ncbi:hypothetical protein OB955_07355 [Halobacteria archaeon AArc-m2/3/4]|uniref:Uncharacterized protein n=1 Tax=Natronoglomus mannanivorans TaxID=2979990 RepID=A0AAP2YWI1_9EURY|nr:hypothetical protein [Halobacteria archaeon AArc-xg1-1]MCU4972554.1 hypothetical protein [Halobacteria archaeon AArc-m2/3/4]